MKRENKKLILGILIGVISVYGIQAIADTTLIAGSKISYSTTTSGLTKTNVQDAIDELYDLAKHDDTYTYPANSKGATTDLGVYHHYRYVNAENVYSKGSADGVAATKVGNATAAQVLSGRTFTNSTTVGATGTMPNNGAVSKSLNCGESYTVIAGYHNGSGTVTANSLASQTGVDSGKTAVAAGQMLTGYQGWVNGNKITGTMPNNGPLNWKPDTSTTYTVPAGYYSGGTLDSSSAYSAGYAAGVAATKVGTAGRAQVLEGYTFTNSSSAGLSGTMKNWSGTPQAIDAVRLANNRFEVAVAAGYHGYSWAGNSYEYLTYKQVADTIGLTAAKIVKGNTILGIAGTGATYSEGYSDGVGATKVGTAGAAQVLTGYTFTNSSTVGATGTMANNGAVSKSLNTSTTSYTIPAGYHNGSGSVSITTQTKSATPSTSSQTITPDSGKVLSSVSISAISTETKSATPTGSSQDITPSSGKYLTKVTVGAVTKSSGIGKTLYDEGKATCTGGNATAAQILSGKTAYVNGSSVTGTMTNNGSLGTNTINPGGSYTIPAGYTSGGTVSATYSPTVQNAIGQGTYSFTLGKSAIITTEGCDIYTNTLYASASVIYTASNNIRKVYKYTPYYSTSTYTANCGLGGWAYVITVY